jgi:hypothetical protein
MTYNYEESKRQQKNLSNILKELGLYEKVTLKKVKTEIGHDMCGYYFDFYLKGYGKIGFVNYDGWGGEILPEYENQKKKEIFESLMKDCEIEKHMIENGWAFMEDKGIDIDTQVTSILEMVLGYMDTLKFEKKRTKAYQKGIVFGTGSSYRSLSFSLPLKAIVETHKGGKEYLQKHYDRIKKDLKENEKIFNDNLEELGIKL